MKVSRLGVWREVVGGFYVIVFLGFVCFVGEFGFRFEGNGELLKVFSREKIWLNLCF